ncbi:MAG TPA: DUF5958 family protein [Pseudonocardiaceae bacterium]|jgi:hypothetical protein|nr:DUF5958 family protein [Pseudonocardiaceae bacterium]
MLNELAQGVLPLAEGVTWFESVDTGERCQILRSLALYCLQARATAQDVPESIRAAGIRPTDTPAVLIARGPTEQQLGKIIRLPEDEWVKAFRLLAALFAAADARRRERWCAAGCAHAWHHLGHADDTPWPAPTDSTGHQVSQLAEGPSWTHRLEV